MPIQGVTTSDLVCIREFIEAKTAEAPAADAKSHEMGMGLLQSYLDWLTKAKNGENEGGGEQLEGGSEQLEGGGEQFSSESSEEDKGSNASSCQPGKRTQFRVSSSTLHPNLLVLRLVDFYTISLYDLEKKVTICIFSSD